MCKTVGMLLLAFLAFSVCRASVAAAVEAVPLPPQVPSQTPSGAVNLTDVWLHSGGGRLYWNTLVTPRQIALEGARFVDPAAVPELVMTPPARKKTPVRHASRKVKASKAAPQAMPAVAPKDAGKTSLQAPAGKGGAAAEPNKAGKTAASPLTQGAPSAATPYSPVAPSSVGGFGGGSSSNAGAAALPAASAPSMFSAEDVLPRANARP